MEHQIRDYQSEPESLKINLTVKDYLLQCAKWGKFLAIMGYIFSGLMILVGLGTFAMGSALLQASGSTMNVGLMGLLYLLLAAIYIYPVYALMRFSRLINIALLSANEDMMTEAFGYLKSIFKFFGIFTIIALAFYAIIILVAIAAGIGAGFAGM